jgi:hypothetical protein
VKRPAVASGSACPTKLVAARCDRGAPRLTREELETFCQKRGLASYVRTSARTGEGLDDLLARMKHLVAWDQKPATVTTTTFKRIKDYVLALKESAEDRPVLVSAEELRTRLEATDPQWRFTDDEMRTAVGHLENYGYVKRLRTSLGEVVGVEDDEHRITIFHGSISFSISRRAALLRRSSGRLSRRRRFCASPGAPRREACSQARLDAVGDRSLFAPGLWCSCVEIVMLGLPPQLRSKLRSNARF